MEVWLPITDSNYLVYAHRLVVQAFISNPKNKSSVNHLNGIRHDNRTDNLEWVTLKKNANRKVFTNPGCGRSRKVVQKTLNGNIIQIWDSARLAGNTLNINSENIATCCRGKQNTTGEYCWIYYDDYIQFDPNEEWRKIEFNSQKFKVSSLDRVKLLNDMIT
ncbi:hypothetical protein Glove_620g4 [Diversispora epigaea]|uniref:HNH nuclease domain-containing protein n=1 Tax=Diversispora epigaea TaxID=1348612 RepID=A0A397GEG6_9GLOM|nr:hypothetical protein Glove_620g4 [Diversispora epigaea]